MSKQPTTQPWHAHISDEEWEGLCDGCGVCCMHKYEDEDTGAIMITSIACGLFDTGLCRCKNYTERFEKVPNCMDLRDIPEQHLQWLPETCAYRLTYEGKPLPDWHYLNSGSRETVHEVGISMRDACTPESEVLEEQWCAYVHDIQEKKD
ncbi:MAG: YcgN family cysteine cluster protein [Ghiorsea sp.]